MGHEYFSHAWSIYIWSINYKRKLPKKSITSSKIMTTIHSVSEWLDTVHTISCNIELHKTAYFL